MALHFIPIVKDKPLVDHIDRNVLNNNINNLRWVNSSENCSNRNAYKNSYFNERYISYINNKGYEYYLISIRQKKYQKCFNMKKYNLNDVIKIRDSIICQN